MAEQRPDPLGPQPVTLWRGYPFRMVENNRQTVALAPAGRNDDVIDVAGRWVAWRDVLLLTYDASDAAKQARSKGDWFEVVLTYAKATALNWIHHQPAAGFVPGAKVIGIPDDLLSAVELEQLVKLREADEKRAVEIAEFAAARAREIWPGFRERDIRPLSQQQFIDEINAALEKERRDFVRLSPRTQELAAQQAEIEATERRAAVKRLEARADQYKKERATESAERVERDAEREAEAKKRAADPLYARFSALDLDDPEKEEPKK